MRRRHALCLALAVLATACQSNTAAPPPIEEPAANPYPSPSAAPIAAESMLPWRVWWRDSGDRPLVSDVSLTPGGESLGLELRAQYQCGQDTLPSYLLGGDWDDPSHATAFGYRFHWVFTERDGEKWYLYTRAPGHPDPGFSDYERTLLGRWRHREPAVPEVSDAVDIVVELLDGGTARDETGEEWFWIAAEGRIEIRRPLSSSSMVVLNCVLSDDLQSYARDSGVQGTRLDR